MPGWNGFDRPVKATFAITPSDSADLPRLTRQLIVGVAGNINVTYAKGGRFVTAVLPVPAGTLDIAVKRLFATSTTATTFTGVA
jgi:hypothetical protein